MSQYINEAFKKFRLLEDYEEFSLSPEGLDNLGSFMGQALDDESVDVIDLEAEAQEDLKKSYVGKVICDCNVCHSNIFFNKEDIVIGEDGIVNAEDECPYCMSNDGYTIIGEIQAYDPGLETEIDTEVSDDELADEPIEIEDEEETEVVKEGLKRKSSKRKLSESKRRALKESIPVANEFVVANIQWSDYDDELIIWEDTDGEYWWVDEAGTSERAFSDIEDAVEDYKFQTGKEYESLQFLPEYSYLIDEYDDKDELASEGDEEDFDESLKLDGVKSLRGTKGLRRRPDKKGVKSLRAREEKSGVEELNEAIEDVTINTEDETMTMTTKEDGGVVVETSPREDGEFYDDFDMDVESDDIDISDDVEAGDEIIAPLSDETEEEIINNSEESEPGFEEETFEDETFEEEPEGEDVEVDEFDEETFDGLGESYLRRCYENVKGYKTTQVRVDENLLKVDGVITFKSGAQKKTNFVFEAKEQKNKRFIFEGYNTQINKGKRAFRLNCSIQNKKVIPMALKYNYSGKNALNESVKLIGVVKSKRK